MLISINKVKIIIIIIIIIIIVIIGTSVLLRMQHFG